LEEDEEDSVLGVEVAILILAMDSVLGVEAALPLLVNSDAEAIPVVVVVVGAIAVVAEQEPSSAKEEVHLQEASKTALEEDGASVLEILVAAGLVSADVEVEEVGEGTAGTARAGGTEDERDDDVIDASEKV